MADIKFIIELQQRRYSIKEHTAEVSTIKWTKLQLTEQYGMALTKLATFVSGNKAESESRLFIHQPYFLLWDSNFLLLYPWPLHFLRKNWRHITKAFNVFILKQVSPENQENTIQNLWVYRKEKRKFWWHKPAFKPLYAETIISPKNEENSIWEPG